MPRAGRPPAPFCLSVAQLRDLRAAASSRTRPHREVQRARVLVALHEHQSPSFVARLHGTSARTVQRLRAQFADRGPAALRDRPRSGRPPSIDPVAHCELIAAACASPADLGVPDRSTWTSGALAEVTVARRPGLRMSRSTAVRVLRRAAIRPHRVKMWCHSPDPEFRQKATRLCELVVHPPPGAVVLCVDEKTDIQALDRRFPVRPAGRGREVRADHHDKRNGTRKLLAAFNVATGEVYGEMRQHRKAVDLVQFMEAVALQHPDRPVIVIWDNLNIHHEGNAHAGRSLTSAMADASSSCTRPSTPPGSTRSSSGSGSSRGG